MMPLVLSMLLLGAAGAHDHAHDAAGTTTPAVTMEDYADNACVQCHRNVAGRSSEIVDLEWAHSVHFQANVACDGCHGGDASLKREQFPSDQAWKEAAHLARNPEFLQLHGPEGEFVSRVRGRSISYFCGRCHTEIMEKHLGSPHGNFGEPSCLYCHGRGSHAIEPASVDIIDTRPRSQAGRCSLCHQAATMKVVADIKAALEKTAERIDSSAERFTDLEGMGYRNLALSEMHHHTADTHSHLRRVFHSFNMREINELARSIEAVAKQTDNTHELVAALHTARKRQTLVGLGAAAFLLVFAGLLIFYGKAYCEHPLRPAGGSGEVHATAEGHQRQVDAGGQEQVADHRPGAEAVTMQAGAQHVVHAHIGHDDEPEGEDALHGRGER